MEALTVSFNDSDKKKPLNKLIDSLIDCETLLGKVFAKTSIKGSIHRFFNEKTFGTFE